MRITPMPTFWLSSTVYDRLRAEMFQIVNKFLWYATDALIVAAFINRFARMHGISVEMGSRLIRLGETG
jgi:hypothetical protein